MFKKRKEPAKFIKNRTDRYGQICMYTNKVNNTTDNY